MDTSPVPPRGQFFLRANVLAGLMFIALAVLGLWLSRNYPVGTALRMGTGYVPRLLCWIMGGLGVVVMVQEFVASDGNILTGEALLWRPLVFVPLSIVIFALTIERLGVVIATVLLIVIGALAGRGMRALEVAITAVLLAALTVGIFVWGLALTIPVWPEW
jgi:hypothetical protein